MNSTITLDRLDRRILEALQRDARLSMASLGRDVGLSPSAASERVKRLEESGVIKNYRAVVDPAFVGLAVQGFIRLSAGGEVCTSIGKIVEDMPEVIECHRVTGDDSAILRIATHDMASLETLIDTLAVHGKPSTALILSSPVDGRALSLFPPVK